MLHIKKMTKIKKKKLKREVQNNICLTKHYLSFVNKENQRLKMEVVSRLANFFFNRLILIFNR